MSKTQKYDFMAKASGNRILTLTQIPVIMVKEKQKIMGKVNCLFFFWYKHYFFQGLVSVKTPLSNH